ncbi:hypothetical protein IMX26_00670 [Clostridium sp. 'deep sea']|uniref:hypothetical protein n=1 Tax=Clostridium sp. 'deep sea' TaxID=2779445 RepID=UPI0018967DB5|nr:hypothetical protein [Clostridium sp. 'deep sea']QOR35388.1 hypothetical protein IMX26_00670 [Clostridium sp. 'deep sea']
MFLIIAVGSSVYFIYESNKYNYIHTFNNSLAFNTKLLVDPQSEQIKKIIEKNYSFKGGWGCSVFESHNKLTTIKFAGFPDVLDKYILRYIKTSDKELKIYGYGVGDHKEKIVQTLQNKAFKIVLDTKDKNKIHLAYKKINIELICENNYVACICIHLTYSNKQNVVF